MESLESEHLSRLELLQNETMSATETKERLMHEWQGAVAARDLGDQKLRDSQHRIQELERALRNAEARAGVAQYKGKLAETFEALTDVDKEVEDEDEVEDGDSKKGRLDPPPHTPPTSADDDEPPSPSHGDSTRHDPVPGANDVAIAEFTERDDVSERPSPATKTSPPPPLDIKTVAPPRVENLSEITLDPTSPSPRRKSAKSFGDTNTTRPAEPSTNMPDASTDDSLSLDDLDDDDDEDLEAASYPMSKIEREKYQELFRKLDRNNTGEANPRHIKKLMSRTGLPTRKLRNIILLSRKMEPAVSDQSCVAVCRLLRLVAFAQSGEDVTAESVAALGSRELPIAHIQGILSNTVSDDASNVPVFTPPTTPSAANRSSYDSSFADTPTSTVSVSTPSRDSAPMFPSANTPMSSRTDSSTHLATPTSAAGTPPALRSMEKSGGPDSGKLDRRIDSIAADFGITQSELGIGLSTPSALTSAATGDSAKTEEDARADSPKSESSADISDISFPDSDTEVHKADPADVDFPRDW